ncbi:MAG TPA: hypothetical protein VH092_07450 [Urbifossiella sp.]|jgi:hypothetical protein|nr:hypothetical protein [Urbifossiella sp.]
MSTKTLAREYKALSATERFGLTTAAAARGDEVEVVRLAAAASRSPVQVTDQFAYGMAFTEVAKDHWANRLHMAALFFRLLHLAEKRGPEQEKARAMARVAAHLLLANADGWGLFCRDAGLDPDGGTGAAEWEETVLQAEAEAKGMGVTDEKAAALAEQGFELAGAGDSGLKTRESVAELLRGRYLERLAHWQPR